MHILHMYLSHLQDTYNGNWQFILDVNGFIFAEFVVKMINDFFSKLCFNSIAFLLHVYSSAGHIVQIVVGVYSGKG